jgi:hypothetical protein
LKNDKGKERKKVIEIKKKIPPIIGGELIFMTGLY